MGIVNAIKGLDTNREIYNFNGKIRNNLDLNWEYTKIYKGSEELTPDYEVKEDEIITIQELPGAATTAGLIIIGIIAAVSIGVAVYSIEEAKRVEREMQEAMERVKKNNKQPDVASIPSLSGGRNEKADSKQAPIILGRHLFTPYFLSESYLRTEGTDGEDLYFYATLLAGQNGLVFEKIRNGTIDLVEFSGNTPQRTVEPIEFGSGDDPFQGFLEIVQKGNEESLNEFSTSIFEQKWVDSLGSTIEIGRKKKDNAQPTENNIYIEDDGEDPIIRETARFPMRAEIEIFLDGLFSWDSENGVAVNASVDIRLEWSLDGTWDNPGVIDMPSPWEPIIVDGVEGYRITRNRVAQMRFIAEIDFPSSIYSKEGNPVFIRARRLSLMRNGGRDMVYVSAIRTKQYNPRNSSNTQLIPAKNIHEKLKDKFCRIGIKLNVNQNTDEALDRFNVIASMSGRTWNGLEWSDIKTKTSNPAAVALEVLTGLIHEPSKYKDNEIDLESFGRLYDYCKNRQIRVRNEEPIDFSLESNGVIINATRQSDILKSILSVCDAGLYINEFGKIIVYYDHSQETPIGLLNPQRIMSMSEEKNLNRKADGYAVEFIDQDSDWQNDTHRILKPNVEEKPGENEYTTIKLDYTTNYYQAMWLARRMMAKEEHRPGATKVQVGREGRLYRPGSLIKVQHERFKIGLGSGEIIETLYDKNMIIGFKLMEKFDIAADRDYYIEWYAVGRDRNRVVDKKQIQSVGEYTDTLMLTVPIPIDSEITPEIFNPLSVLHGEKGTSKVWESKRYIVTELSEVQQGYDLTIVPYSDAVYDETRWDIPIRQSHILSVAPRSFEQHISAPSVLQGVNGITPHIGENGNWWIGDTDTGNSATIPDVIITEIGKRISSATQVTLQQLGNMIMEKFGGETPAPSINMSGSIFTTSLIIITASSYNSGVWTLYGQMNNGSLAEIILEGSTLCYPNLLLLI